MWMHEKLNQSVGTEYVPIVARMNNIESVSVDKPQTHSILACFLQHCI